jgi:hypothetical protein
MNPVLGVKRWSVRTAITLLAALTSVFLTVGCGSTSLPKANSNGFSNSSVNGTYVFSSEGSDSSTGDFLAMAGAFTADGSGGVKGGTMDVVDPSVGAAVAQTITSGSYHVNIDGRGQVTLTSSVGTFTLDFVLTATPSGLSGVSTHGLVSEFDDHGSGSGTLDLQTAVTSLSQLAGPYAFSFSGIDNTSNSFAATGAFTLDSNGNIITGTGIEDFNAGGSIYPGETLTGGPATLGSGTAPGSIAMTTSSFPLTFDFYPIDSTHLKFIETDFTEILVGDAFTQTGASIPTGAMVFTMAGGITAPVVVGGLMTSVDGHGTFSGGLEDVNDDGAISPAQLQFSGMPVLAPSTGGRVVVNLTGFSPAIQWVIYPSSGGLLLQESDGANVMQGIAYAQTATSFSTGTSIGYGLNLTGVDIAGGFEIDDIAQFNATTATSNNMTGILDENDEGSLVPTLSLTGTYTPDSPATGRGSILVPSLGTPLGGLSLEYYVVDDSTVLTIEGDTQQVSAGLFELQSSSAVGPTQGLAAAHRSMFVVHPLTRSRTVKLLKK